MKRFLFLILTLTSLSSFANVVTFKAKIKEISQVEDRVYLVIDAGSTICNFEVQGKCSPLYISYKLSDNLVTNATIDLLETAKANQSDVNLTTDSDERNENRIISVEITK